MTEERVAACIMLNVITGAWWLNLGNQGEALLLVDRGGKGRISPTLGRYISVPT